jgi:hypothetical protein
LCCPTLGLLEIFNDGWKKNQILLMKKQEDKIHPTPLDEFYPHVKEIDVRATGQERGRIHGG